nr:hypothetical protein [Actinomycetota bacterium]
MRAMVDVLRIMLGVAIAASLAVIVTYAVIFFVVAARTAFGKSRQDPLTQEIDAFLAEVLRAPEQGPAETEPVRPAVALADTHGGSKAARPFAGRARS